MISVMRCFFGHVLNQQDLNNNNNPLTLATKKAAWEAAKETAVSIKSVWRHHFGIRLIDGKETLTDDVDSTKIMIYGEKYVSEQIMAVFSEWKAVERLSRRPDRAALLLRKEDSFRNKLSIPFNILKPKGEDILCQAGLIHWEEELHHLRNQLTPEQPGSCDGYDMRQAKRDNRKLKARYTRELKEQQMQREKGEQELAKKDNLTVERIDVVDDDDDFEGQAAVKTNKKKMISWGLLQAQQMPEEYLSELEQLLQLLLLTV